MHAACEGRPLLADKHGMMCRKSRLLDKWQCPYVQIVDEFRVVTPSTLFQNRSMVDQQADLMHRSCEDKQLCTSMLRCKPSVFLE